MARAAAHLDWISFELHTAQPTQRQWVRRRIVQELLRDENDVYVEAIDEQPGGVASRFEVKLQDVTGASVKALLGAVLPSYGQTDATLTGMEFALDEYVSAAGITDHDHRRALASLVADRQVWNSLDQPRLVAGELTRRIAGKAAAKLVELSAVTWGLAVPEPCWHAYRLDRERKTFHAIQDDGGREELVDMLANGWNVRDIRDAYAPPVSRHAYVKTHDRKRGMRREEWRARFEVTLRGARLPCVSLGQLSALDFATMSSTYFSFRRFNPPRLSKFSPPAEKLYRQLHSFARVTGNRRKKYLASTSADSGLNERARQALRTFTERWRRDMEMAPDCKYSGQLRQESCVERACEPPGARISRPPNLRDL